MIATSWRCVGYGRYMSGAWAGEIATVGFSGVADDFSSPVAGGIDEPLPEFDAVAAGMTSSTTHLSVAFGSNGEGNWNNTWQETLCESMWTYLNTIKAFQLGTFDWNEIRLSAIAENGDVVNGATVATITTPLSGSATGTYFSPQTAAVTSLRTGGRGPKNHGRVYVPIHGANVIGSDQLLNSGTQTTLRNAAKAYIDSINALTGVRCCVVSRTHGTYSAISAVATGDELDTQRRRRNGRRETYLSTTVTS